ncbi:MAG: Chloroplast import component protein (Tic20) [Candidatus Omnitrophica bacterium ADurb.Bin277]|nr:MAG: Chloroplast import component protein (Tic20) [Candidatus Omnitrophica bacterium ADurb.Bin277]
MAGENKKTILGVTENLEALLCYAVGWVTGLIFLLLEKENEYVRFHALQSLVTFGALHAASFVFMFIPILGWIVAFCANILGFVIWIVLMVKAYQGERYKLPVAGDFVEQHLAKK